MKIAICDDDRTMREQIASLIRGQEPDAEVITFEAGEGMIKSWWIRQTILSKIVKSAIHVARLTTHEVDVRNHPSFSDKLVEDWRWQIR